MKDDKCKKSESDKGLERKDEFNAEDTTKYGEFISSFFAWVPPEKQKEKANELDNMTKKDKF